MTAIANLQGLFKEKYADKIETLYQTCNILKSDISFIKASQQNGGNFNQPVVMRGEHGFTYAAPNAAGGPLAMNPAVSMQMQNAQVAPYQMAARWVLDYESANRSLAAGAFEPAAMLQMTNVLEQADNRLELSLLYGQEGLAGVSSTTANVDATTANLTIAVGDWSDAIWGASGGAELNLFTGAGALISTGDNAIFTVSAVNITTRVVTVTGTATGITALGTTAVAPFYRGTRTGASAFNEMPGLSKIITNTGSLFNIDAAVYDLWKGNSYAVGGALTFAKLQSAIALPVGRGLVEDVTVYLNPKTWGNLLTEQAALRKYDSSYSTATTKNGSTSITFFSQNGKLEIKPHPFVHQGDAFAIPVSRFRRVGSTDVSFVTPTSNGDKQMWTDLPDVMGYQAKLYTGQTLFTSTPARSVKLTGIVNS